MIQHDEVFTLSCAVLTLSRRREKVGMRGYGFMLFRAASIKRHRIRRVAPPGPLLERALWMMRINDKKVQIAENICGKFSEDTRS